MQDLEISPHQRGGAAVSDTPERGSDPSLPQDISLPDEHARGEDRRIGQVVDGKYHVLRRLACGGMGSVYEARHMVVGRHVALKFLHEQYAQKSCMVQRCLREAQAAGGIASEHIIGVLDYGTHDGTPYLVMELVRGKDLREILSESPRLPAARAVRIVLDACRGLALAHERGLIHRDLKPANICVTQRSDGREVAKVIDFGVAKLRDGAELSEEGTLIGTLGYMAPEQLTDQKTLDARADIYALGVILYQALAGRPPHLCNRSELLYRIVSVDPRPLAELCPDLPPGLAEIVHKALCRNKERRFETVRAFAAELEPFTTDDASPAPQLLARTENLHREALPDPLSTFSREVRGALSRSTPPTLSRDARGDTGDPALGHAPTWAALAPTPHLEGDRQCERVVAARGAIDEYCRHPDGLPLSPLPVQHHQLSQRALLLSVGALALSVVAMTTMFVFVYSHGSGALEAAATASSPAAAKAALAREEHAPASDPPLLADAPPAVGAAAPAQGAAPSAAGAPELATASEHCAAPSSPLQAASALELAADGEGGIGVQRHALTPSPSAYPGARATDCE